MEINVSKCPGCNRFPVYERIEGTDDYKACCSCGWVAIGHRKSGAIEGWNRLMARQHPKVLFESMEVECRWSQTI